MAYEDQPITPFGAAKLGCSLGFVSPTFQVRGKRLLHHIRVQPGAASIWAT